MKKAFIIAFVISLSLAGCNRNNPLANSQSTFDIDGKTFTVINPQGISEIKMPNALVANGVSFDRSTISIVGLNGTTESSTISFDLFYKSGMTVAGTYSIDDDMNGNGFDNFISPLTRGCLGWTSAGAIFILPSAVQLQSNNPSGTVKVIVNSATNYTIQYTGSFKVYDSHFSVVKTISIIINITGTVSIH